MDVGKILDEYRNGDEGCRLRLFLAFRDLRDYFSLIEQESLNSDLDVVKFPGSREQVARAA